MGQAKQRGTFEQRQEAAYRRIDANIEVRKKELEEMEALEKRQLEAMGKYVNHTYESIVKHNLRSPVASALCRADFSQLELRVMTTLSEEEKASFYESLK